MGAAVGTEQKVQSTDNTNFRPLSVMGRSPERSMDPHTMSPGQLQYCAGVYGGALRTFLENQPDGGD